MPKSTTIHLVADEFPDLLEQKSIDLAVSKGFLVSPFEEDAAHKTFLIKPKIRIDFEIEADGKILPNIDLGEELESLKVESSDKKYSTTLHQIEADQSIENFVTNIAEVISSIDGDKVKKVVLANTKTINLPSEFDEIDFFAKLCLAYPNSFISLVNSSISGIWIGATPEVLVSIDQNSIFKTVALAGTKKADPTAKVSQTLWSEKEIEEQALVSRYIIDCFKKIRLREYEEIGPKTVQAGNLLHLKTEFSVDLKEINFENLATVMLNLLHPTSAVCGAPKDIAKKIIHELEPINRAYYSGFLGPVNLYSIEAKAPITTTLFVNIRCMKILGLLARLYSGVGITLDSEPQEELQEIENKFQTLLSVLNY